MTGVPRVATIRLPACGVCGRPCIPLADYDSPVCISCDDAVAVIGAAAFAVPNAPLLDAAAAEVARIYSATLREHEREIEKRRQIAESMTSRANLRSVS